MEEEKSNNENGEQETKKETEVNKSENNAEDLNNRISNIEKPIYEAKKRELEELEKKIDKKMKDFKTLVEDAESMGITEAGKGRVSQEELKKEEAKEFFKGTQIEEAIEKYG
jgi:hypothetical protein